MIILVDQIAKFIILQKVPLYDRIEVIRGFFQVTHVHNSGAVWGIFSNHPRVLVSKIITVLSLAALFIVFYYFFRIQAKCYLELTSLSFIIGGALGNITDRIKQGYVVDFLDFYIKDAHWPTFNLADSFITVGVIILVISIWRGKCTQF